LAPGMDTVEARGMALLEMGPQYVLVKGADEDTEAVHNLLFGGHRLLHQFDTPRLPHQYHGSGCTLAAAIAGLLAQGSDPFTAVHQALDYTYAALENGAQLGHGQHVPHRLFWADSNESDALAQLEPGNASIH